MPTSPQDHRSSEFTWPSEAGTITLPLRLKVKTLRKARGLDEVEFMFTLLDDVADEESRERIDELDVYDLKAMFVAWQKEHEARHEASLGESSRSSG